MISFFPWHQTQEQKYKQTEIYPASEFESTYRDSGNTIHFSFFKTHLFLPENHDIRT